MKSTRMIELRTTMPAPAMNPIMEVAVKNAPIVTAITRAREPIVTARMLAEGAHFNAVGAITPEREEFTQDVFDRVDLIAVDMVEFQQKVLPTTFYDALPAPYNELVSDAFVIAGWVLLWRPLELLFYEWIEPWRDAKDFERLAELPLELRADGA